MGRVARLVLPGYPHHLTQRGNRKQAVFLESSDYQEYMRLLARYAKKHGISIWAYCLMPNHIHLIGVPEKPDSFACAIREGHSSYSRWFNCKHGFSGHLWQSRFYSVVLDDPHLWTAVRYVEQNPVRAGMVRAASDYLWSSALAHCQGEADPLLSEGFPPEGVIGDWSEWLEVHEDEMKVRRLREQTRTGRPVGSSDFLRSIKPLSLKPIVPKKRGRKKKSTS